MRVLVKVILSIYSLKSLRLVYEDSERRGKNDNDGLFKTIFKWSCTLKNGETEIDTQFKENQKNKTLSESVLE